MIDLDKFCKEVHVCSATGYMIGISSGEFKELITRLRQAEKDAERYRWLRDELWQPQGGIALFDGACHVCDIDLFIDEAMQCSK